MVSGICMSILSVNPFSCRCPRSVEGATRVPSPLFFSLSFTHLESLNRKYFLLFINLVIDQIFRWTLFHDRLDSKRAQSARNGFQLLTLLLYLLIPLRVRLRQQKIMILMIRKVIQILIAKPVWVHYQISKENIKEKRIGLVKRIVKGPTYPNSKVNRDKIDKWAKDSEKVWHQK